MSLSVLLVSAGVVGICGFIFKKTVSNDAKNDFTLRDILSSDSPYEEVEEVKTAPSQDITKPKFFNELRKEEAERETERDAEPVMTKTVEPEENSGSNYSYSTNAYSTNTHETNRNQEEKNDYTYDSEPVYYEKINDDACEPDYNSDDDYEEVEEEYMTGVKRSIDFDDYKEEKEFKQYEEPVKTVKKSFMGNLFGFIKTFWRGITFSLGALICLYAFYGVVAQAQTANDAILYSIWLLIGVILIK